MTSAAAALGTLFGTGVVMAQDGIYNVVVNLSSLSSGSANDSEVSTGFEIGHTAGPGANDTFTSRYGFNVNADSKSVSRSKLAQAVHQVSFEVRSSRGYSLIVSSGWIGQMIREADTLQCAEAVTLSGVTGDVLAGFGVTSGSLSLPDPPDITLLTSGDESVILSDVSDATIRVTNPQPIEIHTLRFAWEAGVLSNTCEAAIRLGASSGTTTECPICGYPGTPPRTQQDDGHFVNIQYFPSNCGNGNLDSGEECDLGEANGFGACCDVFCELEPDGMPCTDGLFCTGDDRCNSSGVCEPLGNPCAALPGCSVCDESADMCVACSPTPTNTPGATAPSTATETPVASATTTNTPDATAPATATVTPVATATSTAPATPMASATATATTTTTPVAGETPTPTTVAVRCVGDCDGNGSVGINELIQAVRIALGDADISSCAAVDADRTGTVAINELIQAVNSALTGCI